MIIVGASLVIQMMKNLPVVQGPRFDPWVGKIPWRREWPPALVFLPGEFHGQSSLVGYSSWGCKHSDTAEQLTLSHFHLHNNNILKSKKYRKNFILNIHI